MEAKAQAPRRLCLRQIEVYLQWMQPIDWAFYHKAHKEDTKVHKGINGSEGTSTTAFMLAPDWAWRLAKNREGCWRNKQLKEYTLFFNHHEHKESTQFAESLGL
jgi:hypothetical protein